jgi:iron complex transport system substrate-binding protein
MICLAAPPARAREIVDMLGRRVAVPERITKVVALSPPATYLVYSIDPTLLAGLNFPLWENEKRFTSEAFRRLPVIGGRVGEGRQLNLEVLMGIAPDVAVLWTQLAEPDAIDREYERTLGQLGIPAVYARIGPLRDYPAALRFMGELLGRRDRADELRAYTEGILARVDRALASLPPAERVSVYYAEGLDGLATDGEGSMHTELIPICGGRNVRQAPPRTQMGMETISAEQLLLYDPDVVLVKERAAFERLPADARLRTLRAVRERRVFLIPYLPFNWFDRPPSFMRVLGAQWLANLLHPDRFQVDMVSETKRFYQLFLGVELDDAQAKEVLGR